MSIELRRKIIDRQAFLILAAAFILIFFFPCASANSFIDYMADSILNCGSSVVMKTLTDPTYALYGVKTMCIGNVDETLEEVKTAINVLKALGLLMAFVITATNAAQELEKEQDFMELGFKAALEFLVTVFCIMNAEDVMRAVAEIGVALVETFGGSVNETDNTALRQQLLETLTGKTDGAFIWFIKSFAILSIPWVLSLLIDIAAKFVIMQILIEIIIIRAFAPLGIVGIYKEGMRSEGIMYIKHYFACFIKLMLCAFISILMGKVLLFVSMTGVNSVVAAFDWIFTIIAINLAAIGLMLKGGSYANIIMGIHG